MLRRVLRRWRVRLVACCKSQSCDRYQGEQVFAHGMSPYGGADCRNRTCLAGLEIQCITTMLSPHKMGENRRFSLFLRGFLIV